MREIRSLTDAALTTVKGATASFFIAISAALTGPAALAGEPVSVSALPAADESWSLCRAAAHDVGAALGMPESLLAAIAVTETGIRGKGRPETAPWPWTINAEGKGYRFATREEAITATRRLRNSGVESIDVGCMQVNLKYHPRAFTSIEEAFDPTANIAYAAEFLAHLNTIHDSWQVAVRAYHSHDVDNGNAYGKKIDRFWKAEQQRAARKVKTTRATARLHMQDLSQERGSRVLASLGTPVAAVFDQSAPQSAPSSRQMAMSRLRQVAARSAPDAVKTQTASLSLEPTMRLGRAAHLGEADARFVAASWQTITAPALTGGRRSADPAAAVRRASFLVP